MKILCAIDDSGYSERAIAVSSRMAKAFGADLTLLAVNELLGGHGRAGADYVWTDETIDAMFAKAVKVVEESGGPKPAMATLSSGDVASAIAGFAEENGFDHIVLGTGGKGAVSRLVLGSVSRDVIARAHCPVTVAR